MARTLSTAAVLVKKRHGYGVHECTVPWSVFEDGVISAGQAFGIPICAHVEAQTSSIYLFPWKGGYKIELACKSEEARLQSTRPACERRGVDSRGESPLGLEAAMSWGGDIKARAEHMRNSTETAWGAGAGQTGSLNFKDHREPPYPTDVMRVLHIIPPSSLVSSMRPLRE